jgi:hypothetical protein
LVRNLFPYLAILPVLTWSSCARFDLSRASKVEVVDLEFGHPVVGENRLDLAIKIKGPGALRALLEGVSPQGVRFRSERDLRVPKSGSGRFELVYSVTVPGMHRANLRIYDLRSAKIVFQSNEYQVGVLPAWEFTHDRSYYTSEDSIRFRSRFNRAENAASAVVVELGNGDSTLVRTELRRDQGELEGSIATAGLPPGEYTLAARLLGEGGIRDSIFANVRKLPPARHEVKLDLFTKTLLRNGDPFFPIGIYWLRKETLAEVKQLRFNSGDYYYKLADAAVEDLMDAATEEGVAILLELSDHIRNLEVPDTTAIYEKVKRYRDHPALLAWYLVDEPADAAVKPTDTMQIYQRIRVLDPYHPVSLVNNRPHTFADYIGSSDVLAIDPYPVPNYAISRVSDYARQARWASMTQKPVWLVAQAFGGVEHWPRAPTAAELRNMVYQGLAQGVSGVFFYRYCSEDERNIQPHPLWREVRRLARELETLSPVLMAEDRTAMARRVGGTGDLQIMIRETNREYYLIAVNPTHGVRQSEYRLERLMPLTGVEVVSGPNSLNVTPDGRLRLELGPLGAGVYRLLVAGV